MIGLKRGTVKILSYQVSWKILFEEESAKLRSTFNAKILQIEHVGSTSIEGMSAKPILDIMVGVESFEKAQKLIPIIESLGYEYKQDDIVQERIFFVKGPEINRTHHLFLIELNSDYWINHILFRDYLRSHKDKAEEYKKLKIELSSKYPESRYNYTESKKDFIDKILALALSSAV